MTVTNPAIVFIETAEDGGIMSISLECLSMGRKLAKELNTGLAAFIAGSNTGKAAEELKHYNINAVYSADSPDLSEYQPEYYVSVFESLCGKIRPRAILFGNTLKSIDLAPRVAFRLNTGLITDCVGIESSNGELQFIKPVYSSNIMAAFALNTEPFMATIRTRSIEAEKRSENTSGEIIPLEVNIDKSIKKIELTGKKLEEEEGPKLTGADIIISGGRGIGGPEGFKALSEIAKILSCALGASRPPCDLGWAPSKAQVGQTGEIVAPSVYIAVAISGSTQHLAGMSGSKKIVAINKDPNANIFAVADYGVVGNYEEIIPSFKNTLQEIIK